MFMRSISVAAGVLAAAGTLAVASAMATDEPAPAPAPAPAPQTQPCVDHKAPLSRLRTSWQRGFRTGVIRGMAIDQGCGAGGAGKVKRVDVAIARKSGKHCQNLRRNGSLGRAGACAKRVWLPAKGTKSWSFKLRHKLRAGVYVVSSRAVDAAGNIEARARR
jgi:hypothetical protein